MRQSICIRALLMLLLTTVHANSAAQTATDITDTVLSSRAHDCAAYAGTYRAEVFDHHNNQQAQGQLQIEAAVDRCTFTVNQIPNHDFGKDVKWPHEPAPNPTSIVLPRHPEVTSTVTWLGLSQGAILLNGVGWESNPAACFGEGKGAPGRERIGCGPRFADHPWRYNVGADENKFSFDPYKAHVQREGLYHYHSTPRVLYTKNAKLLTDTECEKTGLSPVIGFALDGFPLHGPCITDESGRVRVAKSSYQLKTGIRAPVEGYTTPYVVGLVVSNEYNGQFVGDYKYTAGHGDLDECNGMTVDGQYGYYVTTGFPYAMRCFKGETLAPVR